MTILWTAPAVRGLREIWIYIAKDKPGAAAQLVSRLRGILRGACHTTPHGPRRSGAAHAGVGGCGHTPTCWCIGSQSRRVEILAALHGARIA